MPTGRSSADRSGQPAQPGPVAALVFLLGMRAAGLRRRSYVGIALAVVLLVTITVGAVGLAQRAQLPPELVEGIRDYLPAGYLGFFLTTATAVLFGGGGREALPAEQVTAFPVGPTTDHLAGLVFAPLNLAWLLQTWSLLASVTVLTRGGHTWAALVSLMLWLLACTAAVQLLSWLVEYVRRGPRGELLVRSVAGVLGLGIVAAVATDHIVEVTAWTPAVWAAGLATHGAAGDWGAWLLGSLVLVAAIVAAVLLGVLAARRTWRRPATTQAKVETKRYAPRATAGSDLLALVAVDRRSVWRSAPLRRGLLLLGLLPVMVAFAGRIDWLMVPVLPGLVASGAVLLFGVNAWSLDARGAVWRESLPVAPRTVLLARAWVLVEVLLVAALATLAICAFRAGPPNPAELTAALGATTVVALRTVASGLRWSVRRPYSVDLRSVRATPAPPAVMVAYSARLALVATLTGMVFSVVGRLFPWWWSALLALALIATSVFSLWRTARLWERPTLRSRVVETVASV